MNSKWRHGVLDSLWMWTPSSKTPCTIMMKLPSFHLPTWTFAVVLTNHKTSLNLSWARSPENTMKPSTPTHLQCRTTKNHVAHRRKPQQFSLGFEGASSTCHHYRETKFPGGSNYHLVISRSSGCTVPGTWSSLEEHLWSIWFHFKASSLWRDPGIDRDDVIMRF